MLLLRREEVGVPSGESGPSGGSVRHDKGLRQRRLLQAGRYLAPLWGARTSDPERQVTRRVLLTIPAGLGRYPCQQLPPEVECWWPSPSLAVNFGIV